MLASPITASPAMLIIQFRFRPQLPILSYTVTSDETKGLLGFRYISDLSKTIGAKPNLQIPFPSLASSSDSSAFSR